MWTTQMGLSCPSCLVDQAWSSPVGTRIHPHSHDSQVWVPQTLDQTLKDHPQSMSRPSAFFIQSSALTLSPSKFWSPSFPTHQLVQHKVHYQITRVSTQSIFTREIELEFSKRTGQIATIRCRSWPENYTEPLLLHILSFPHLFLHNPPLALPFSIFDPLSKHFLIHLGSFAHLQNPLTTSHYKLFFLWVLR